MKLPVLKPLIRKSTAEIDAMTPEEKQQWQDVNAKTAEDNQEAIKKFAEDAEADINQLNDSLKAQGIVIEELKTANGEVEKNPFAKALKTEFDKHLDAIKSFDRDTSVSIEMKATQTYGDIDLGSDFAQMRPGITDQPVRRAGVIRSLFGMIPVSTEFYKYTYQETVIRDAQNVALCAPVTSTTKETLKVDSIQTRKIKDIMKFCLEFVADYPFMESRIRKLITESVALRVDQQILLGTNTGQETDSINRVSSEFDAANVECPIAASIQDATMVDLILGMRTQIVELGKQNFFIPDTVLVNLCDWFTMVESRKDADGNYIDSRVSYINGMPYIGGMLVVTSPLVAAGTLYVFDSTKGEIVDRRRMTVEIATENAEDWESEIASIKAFERLNFLVIENNQNAFMKSSDIAVAIASIDKP